jgi:hypothetical protein
MKWGPAEIVTYILNFIIIFITLYLIFLLIKSRSFKIYPCYNITILSFIIFFDNILRIIPSNGIIEYPQAFLLTSLDKLLLTTITSQAIITFLGVCLTKIYFANEKKIFLTTLIAGISISCILSLLYILIANRTHVYSTYAYCEDSHTKRITDTIFNAIFLLINLFCTLALLIYITKKRRQASLGIIEDLDYGHHHTKIVFMFLFNSLLFIESYLIIYDKFPGNEVDLIYLISCLLILFYYTINKIIIKETLKLFCKSYYESKYGSIKKNECLTDDDDDDDDEEQKNEKKSDSFSDD